MKMKGNYLVFFIFLLFLSLVVSTTSARLLVPKQGQKEAKANGIAAGGVTETKEDFSDLMGSIVCDDKDEACLKGRMIVEAHLDYIYTQHHKP